MKLIPKHQSGSLLQKLNPKNWGVNDYTDKEDFNNAYSSARKSGEKEFMWNGKRYSTKAYTDKNTSGNIINKIIVNNTYPYTASTKGKFKLDNDVLAKAKSDYGKKNIDIKKLVKIYDTAKSDEYPNITFGEYRANTKGGTGRIPEPSDITPSYDALFLQQGLPQKYNSFEEAKYVPSERSGNLNTIYKFNNKWEEDLWKDLSEYGNSDFLKSNETERYVKGSHVAGASLKNFKYSKGKDNRGEYVSYYDKNDYGNILDYVPNSKTFDIYGRLYYKDYGDGQKKRMYYSDEELGQLNPQNKDFDTLALQRELSNRGQQLPGSTKKDGSFDGVWGDETKQALLNWQNKNKMKLIPKNQTGGIARPRLKLDINTPTFTTRELNPFVVNRDGVSSAGKDGRMINFKTYAQPGTPAHLKGVGAATPNFQIKDSGVLRPVPEEYQSRWSNKDLKSIGFTPSMWKGAKTTGIFYQDGKEYPVLSNTKEGTQYNRRDYGGTTSDTKWSNSGRELIKRSNGNNSGKLGGRILSGKKNWLNNRGSL